MNKKEVLEVKKQLTHERCTIDKICGCYVDHEKVKKVEFNRSFLTLPEDESFKYFDLFKKVLSGTLGKNLFSLDYSLEDEESGTPHDLLVKLNRSKLESEELLDVFYDYVIQNYPYPENYFIVLIHSNYDVPGKGTDSLEMHDASDTVYSHIICAICPVNLSKAALSYNAATNNIEDRMRDWIVDPPLNGFLFPSFTDRSSDIHSVLYYSKLPEDIKPEFVSGVLGSNEPLTAKDQQYGFEAIVCDTLEDEADFETIKTIHETLNEMLEEAKDEPNPLTLSKPDIKHILEKSGVPEEKMETFDREYEETLGDDHSLMATNLTNTKSFEIKTPDIVVKVNPKRTDLVETREIDGRKCLVIAIDDHLMVNGIDVNK